MFRLTAITGIERTRWHYLCARLLAAMLMGSPVGTPVLAQTVTVSHIELDGTAASKTDRIKIRPLSGTKRARPTVQVGDHIAAGSEIYVPRRVQLVLVDRNQNTIVVRANSRLRLSEAQSKRASLVDVVTGQIVLTVREALDFFGVRHKQIVASVKGTEFSVAVSADSSVNVSVREGSVRVRQALRAEVDGTTQQPALHITGLSTTQTINSQSQGQFAQSAKAEPTLHFGNYDEARRYFESTWFASLAHDDSELQYHKLLNLMTVYHQLAMPAMVKALVPACSLTARASAIPGAQAACLNQLGAARFESGDSAGAMAAYRSAIGILDQVGIAQDDSTRAAVLNNLAGSAASLGDDGQAIAALSQALEIMLRQYGQQAHPTTATILANLANRLAVTSDIDSALQAAGQALVIRQELFATREHSDLAQSYAVLGSVLDRAGRSDDGMALLQHALAIWRRLHPHRDHPDVVLAHNRLGAINERRSEWNSARHHYQAGADMARRLGTHISPQIASAPVLGLARILANLNKLDAARLHAGRAVALLEPSVRPDHPTLIAGRQLLAAISYRQGRYHDADQQFGQILHGLPPSDEQVSLAMRARVLNNRGLTLSALDDHAGAIELHEQALQIRRRLSGPESTRDQAQSLTNLARSQVKLADHANAQTHIQEALALLNQVHEGRDNEQTAIALTTYSIVLQAQHKLADALLSNEQALAMRRRLLPAGPHPSVAFGLARRGRIEFLLDRPEDAARSQISALAIMAQVHPAYGHPEWLQTLHEYAETQKVLGDAGAARTVRRAHQMQAQLEADR